MAYDVDIARHTHYGLLNLRGTEDVCRRFNGVLGLELPQTPNTATANGRVTAMWLGPDEWLIRTDDGNEPALSAALLEAVRGRHAAVTAVSDAYVIFTVSGQDARAVLNQGTGIDLHPRSFNPGTCVRTSLGKTGVILHQPGDKPYYDVYAWRSYANYLSMWLDKAAGTG